MSPIRPTRQLLDPAGTLAIYPTTVSLAVLAFASGVIPTVGALVRGEGNPALLVAALMVFGGCCATAVIAGSPYRAPFTARSHFVVHSLAVLAFVVSSTATWDPDTTFGRGNWVALALGVLLIAVSPYRPVAELIGAGSVTAMLIALAAFAKAELVGTTVPPLAVAAAAAVAVLALCYGSAAYSARTILALQRSRKQADVASDALSDELKDSLVRLVREDRATILERDVRPFFAEIVNSPVITTAQKERANQISDRIRRAMVEDADRTWLGALFANSFSEVLNRGTIDDPSTAAPAMNMTQRTALRAFLVAVGGDERAREISMAISADDRARSGVIRVSVDSSDRDVRARYGPYLAVMRVAFSASSVTFERPSLTVRFSYDRA